MKQHKNINQEAAPIFLKTIYQHNIQLLKILLSSGINCCFTNIVSLDRVQSWQFEIAGGSNNSAGNPLETSLIEQRRLSASFEQHSWKLDKCPSLTIHVKLQIWVNNNNKIVNDEKYFSKGIIWHICWNQKCFFFFSSQYSQY